MGPAIYYYTTFASKKHWFLKRNSQSRMDGHATQIQERTSLDSQEVYKKSISKRISINFHDGSLMHALAEYSIQQKTTMASVIFSTFYRQLPATNCRFLKLGSFCPEVRSFLPPKLGSFPPEVWLFC